MTTREVYCLPRDIPRTDQLWLGMRDTKYCQDQVR